MRAICANCGCKINFFKIKIKDGYICGPCQNMLPMNAINRKEEMTGEEIREAIRKGRELDESRPDLIEQAVMSATKNKKESDDKFEEVRKYKKLYEDGIITEEEYEAKRKELLDL